MSKAKSKGEIDRELDAALKDTVPGSDPVSIVVDDDDQPIRPVGRRPPELDRELVDQLSQQTKKRRQG
jgi:hypothetical protein